MEYVLNKQIAFKYEKNKFVQGQQGRLDERLAQWWKLKLLIPNIYRHFFIAGHL